MANTQAWCPYKTVCDSQDRPQRMRMEACLTAILLCRCHNEGHSSVQFMVHHKAIRSGVNSCNPGGRGSAQLWLGDHSAWARFPWHLTAMYFGPSNMDHLQSPATIGIKACSCTPVTFLEAPRI